MAHVYKYFWIWLNNFRGHILKIQSLMFSDRVTRTLFTLGELTLADPQYTGPFFDLDKIAKDVNDKVIVKIGRWKETQNNVGPNSPSCWQFEDGPLIETPETSPLPLHGIKMPGILPPVMQCKDAGGLRRRRWFERRTSTIHLQTSCRCHVWSNNNLLIKD